MRWTLTSLLLIISSMTFAAEPTPEAITFFENKVRPILVEHCVRCHGEKKQQGELRLDTAEGLAKGADGVAVVVPGDADKSKLIQSVRRLGDYAMPPDKPLAKEQVETLVAWVKTGAAFPKGGSKTQTPANNAASHWAYQPIRDAAVPTPKRDVGPNPIDKFVQAKLEANGLTLNAPATKEVLIRRVYYDLIGLPPTMVQVQNFLNDTSPQAFAKVVDELLASPHYGERWGRYWLDIARYADTKGYVFTEDRNYPNAYTYRDYVIRSLNADKPYDQFVREQLAADLLPTASDKKTLAGLGFLTVGRRFSNNPHDIIDDRIDVVTRGLMGLTVQCARCHDHKFDPVGINDYYSLYGIFNATTEPKDNYPIIAEVERTPALEKYEAEVKKREAAIVEFQRKRYAEILAELKTPENVKKYLEAALSLKGKPNEAVQQVLRDGVLRPAVLERYRKFVMIPERFRFTATFATGPTDVPFTEFDKLVLRDDREKVTRMKAQVDKFVAGSNFTPQRAMVLNDQPNPGNIQVFLRGNPNNRGPVIPRQFLQIGAFPKTEVKTGSGRLPMAEAVTSPKNPLTARVIVNRVWMYHFGKPLVNTPSDFGLRSEPPTHPEMLDYLATRFMTDDGWSVKKLHRG